LSLLFKDVLVKNSVIHAVIRLSISVSRFLSKLYNLDDKFILRHAAGECKKTCCLLISQLDKLANKLVSITCIN
jgi:hypothetical protein